MSLQSYLATCTTKADVSSELGDAESARVGLLTGALHGHTLDPSGLYTDRAGFFGRGWLPLLSDLGLTESLALNTLAMLTDLIQGQRGTFTIWSAFTATLDSPEAHVPGVKHVAPTAELADYDEWRLVLAQLGNRLQCALLWGEIPWRVSDLRSNTV